MLWLSRFSAVQEAELVTTIRRFAQIYGPVLSTGSGCSGTDIVSKCDADICSVLREKYGVNLRAKPVLACEWDKQKQFVLMKENPEVDLLVPDLAMMRNQRVPNRITNEEEALTWVPEMDIYRCGSSCLWEGGSVIFCVDGRVGKLCGW